MFSNQSNPARQATSGRSRFPHTLRAISLGVALCAAGPSIAGPMNPQQASDMFNDMADELAKKTSKTSVGDRILGLSKIYASYNESTTKNECTIVARILRDMMRGDVAKANSKLGNRFKFKPGLPESKKLINKIAELGSTRTARGSTVKRETTVYTHFINICTLTGTSYWQGFMALLATSLGGPESFHAATQSGRTLACAEEFTGATRCASIGPHGGAMVASLVNGETGVGMESLSDSALVASVRVLDMNNDGLLDVVTTALDDGLVHVHEGTGDGGFLPAEMLLQPRLTFFDANEESDLDVELITFDPLTGQLTSHPTHQRLDEAMPEIGGVTTTPRPVLVIGDSGADGPGGAVIVDTAAPSMSVFSSAPVELSPPGR